MVPSTKQALVIAEMSVMLLTHSVRGFLRGLPGVVHDLGFACMLVDMRIDTESAPSIPRNEEVPEPHFSPHLIRKPHLEITPLDSWFVFHYLFSYF